MAEDKQTVDQEKEDLKTKLAATQKELKAAQKLHKEAEGDAKAWKKKHDDLAAQKAESTCPDGDHVMWQGVVHDVHHSNSVKELAIDMGKRFVAENLTAVVINKLH